MGKPRILILENSISHTGALNSIVRSSEMLKDAFQFFFVLPSRSTGIPFLQQKGFDVYELPMKELRKDFLSLITYIPFLIINSIRLSKLIRKLEIDIVHSNDFYNLLPSVYKFFGGNVPYISHVRFLPSKFPGILVNLWCGLHNRYAFKIIAVSEAVKKEVPKSDKVVVIGNELPREVPYVPASSTLILYPANYIRGKGHEYALESFTAICKKYPSWKLRFVGGDMGLQKNKDFKEWLIKTAEQSGVSKQIEWRGFASNMAAEYNEASIVLNFSESESFSLTCLEAMFYGRAIIATECGGPSEIIDANKTGLLVRVKDVEAMTKAIELLIKDQRKREELAQNARKAVRIKYSDENTVQVLERNYLASVHHKKPNFQQPLAI